MLLKNIFFNKLGYLHKLLFNLITNFLEYFIEVQRLFHFELQMSPLHCFPHFPQVSISLQLPSFYQFMAIFKSAPYQFREILHFKLLFGIIQ